MTPVNAELGLGTPVATVVKTGSTFGAPAIIADYWCVGGVIGDSYWCVGKQGEEERAVLASFHAVIGRAE